MQDILDRRAFLSALGGFVSSLPITPDVLRAIRTVGGNSEGARTKAYGSGHFGEWVTDEFDLPAFHYTCDQTKDPAAVTPIDPAFLSPTNQMHQVGNDRLVAVVSNYGYVQVRQDEGAPKFLNDFCPERGQYGGGIGFLTDGDSFLSTYYPGNAGTFDRTFGIGYVRKQVGCTKFAVDQVIFAPFGDDPVLVSQVRVTNRSDREANLRWIEYWGCQPYQFSYRSYMQARTIGKTSLTQDLRRDFNERFAHDVQIRDGNRFLLEQKRFLGRTSSDKQAWREVLSHMGKPLQDPGAGSSRLEDLDPPSTFLASLDGPADRFSANGKAFFGSGGVSNPKGLAHELDTDLNVHGPEAALLLERRITLKPGESRTLYFLYGYVPQGTNAASLIDSYRKTPSSLWAQSSEKWKNDGMHFSTSEEPWVGRELTWDHYYLRSNLTYDSFFQEHILSQGHVYQYLIGFQGAARDPLQHVLPFVFSNPRVVKEILRYTLKEVRADGSIPYGIIGYGMTMPGDVDNASDLPLWVLWVASEYVLATRDTSFLSEEIPTYPLYGPEARKESVRNLLARCYTHMVNDVGVGQHGIMRMLMDDLSDAIVGEHVPPKLRGECLRTGESTFNSAMAAYVFDFYAKMLTFAGESNELAADAISRAEAQRSATRAQWTGRWFRRAWLGPTLGWVGENSLWIEPQPWTIIGRVTSPEQARELVRSIDDLLRQPSPIGAMQVSRGDRTAEEMGARIGTSQDGGVWPSFNGQLIWALARIDGAMAWDEWKKNSFARHAEVYPEIWYGTWSGPDTLNSVLNDYPGGTMLSDTIILQKGQKGPLNILDDAGWTDFPVMNMHPHAWPLYTIPKLLGVEFTSEGVELAPTIPLKTYRFDSPLLGVVKLNDRYEGWYAPFAQKGKWSITIRLPQKEAEQITMVEVNGIQHTAKFDANGAISLIGEGGPGEPFRWMLRK